MPTIGISVKKKKAFLGSGERYIVRDNSDYVINFSFDDEWADEIVKTARFTFSDSYIDVPFTGNSVAVPIISAGRIVEVGVFAGDLRTTTGAPITLVPSIRSKNGAPVEPESSVYDKIMEMLDNLGGKTPATTETLGMIKVGKNLSITKDGTLSAEASGGGGKTEVTDDGEGNIVITSLAAGLMATDDGAGNITFGGA